MIEVNCDPRDAVDEDQKFKATLDPNRPNRVVVEVPAIGYAKLHDSDAYKQATEDFNAACDRTRLA
jgi:hypothetical protein